MNRSIAPSTSRCSIIVIGLALGVIGGCERKDADGDGSSVSVEKAPDEAAKKPLTPETYAEWKANKEEKEGEKRQAIRERMLTNWKKSSEALGIDFGSIDEYAEFFELRSQPRGEYHVVPDENFTPDEAMRRRTPRVKVASGSGIIGRLIAINIKRRWAIPEGYIDTEFFQSISPSQRASSEAEVRTVVVIAQSSMVVGHYGIAKGIPTGDASRLHYIVRAFDRESKELLGYAEVLGPYPPYREGPSRAVQDHRDTMKEVGALITRWTQVGERRLIKRK